ncbi:hypothetical protein MVES1_002757 [Malassezia vespertilionis]|uniref:Rab-GAP TBC domain-containing protein n=1 Tax=Malassezia vespertilionis TaxID=2020962 RepID=A0A2N1JAR5_9BASI|nr:uncharacterized protein MVES1_002757 [Malassezia vespertilionis]PKI83623.1 hypothetical protein MVES_002605 [Malassezia vespertilionis]WFD07393.1 hypothetical protein MVES1_002757 [Malassezia vespertilionis]
MSVVTLEEFLELLNEEQYLDLNKLRNYARHGIQPQVRGEVWLYLLGVLAANKSQEMTTVRSKFLEYESFSKRIPSVEKLIRTEVLRYFRQRFHVHKGSPERFGLSVIRGPRSERGSYGAPKSEAAVLDCLSYPRILPSTQYGLLIMRSNPPLDDTQAVHAQRRLSQIVENVLCAYLNGQIGVQIREEEHTLPETKHDEDYASLQHQIESRMPHAYQWAPQASVVPGTSIVDFHPSLVYLCVPFAMCVRAEAGIYFAFARLMTMIEDYNRVHPLPHRVASFLTLFRTTLPELHTYFEAEEVDLVAVATSWLQHLLAREMQMDDLMRLWDTYFAVPDLLDLHLYVCLAILTNCKDALEDLDRSETTSMLFSLPPLDVDRIISDATNIRLSLENDQLYE